MGHTIIPLLLNNLAPGLAALVENASSASDGIERNDRVLAGGLEFDVYAHAEGYDEHLRHALEQGLDSAAPECTLHICRRGGPGAPAWPMWRDAYFREREVEASLQDGRYRLHYFDECDFWQVYDREARIGVQLMPDATTYPAWDPGAPLRNFVHWRLLDASASLVHAGTLAVEGNGLLLAGPGGSGKSGSVLAGLHSGLQSVGDDYVAVRLKPQPIAIRAFRTLKQDPAGLARIGIDHPKGQGVNWQGKYLLRIEDVASAPQRDKLDLKAICLPTVSHTERTMFSPGTAQDAFLALAPSGITQIPSARPEMFSFAARLSKSLPVFHVRLGADPAEVASAFASFLERRA